MDTYYCLKCKKQTKNLNSKGFVTKNKKYLVKSVCNICKSTFKVGQHLVLLPQLLLQIFNFLY